MDVFDEIFLSLKNAATVAGQKTGEVVEISKLKLDELQCNADIQKAYEKLGALTYEMMKTGTKNMYIIESCVEDIDELREKIFDINEKIHVLKKMVKCPKCAGSNNQSALYCSKCGMNLREGLQK